MTISELAAMLPGTISLKPEGVNEDDMEYHFWFTEIDFGKINTDDKGDITTIDVDKKYQGQIESNQEINEVLQKNNLIINYV